MNRSEVIDQFIETIPSWHGAKRAMLAGDASFRKYERISLRNNHAVLMDAPPDKEDTRPFLKVANYLTDHTLSAPRIIAYNTENGLALLEDLGDDLYARVLVRQPELEEQLYLSATDVLVELYHMAEKENLEGFIPTFDTDRMLQQVALLPEWFMPLASGWETPDTLKKEYLDIWRSVLAKLPPLRRVMVLYDYHAENMIWLPDREKAARTGLLDFQDAMVGSPAYDMVSFLEDARRDVAETTVQKTIEHYLQQTGIAHDAFMAAYKLMGAQRNCRIVGTFARLAVRDGKKRYLSFMPRVWAHVMNDVSHPLLAPVKEWIEKNIKPEWRV